MFLADMFLLIRLMGFMAVLYITRPLWEFNKLLGVAVTFALFYLFIIKNFLFSLPLVIAFIMAITGIGHFFADFVFQLSHARGMGGISEREVEEMEKKLLREMRRGRW